MRIDWVIRCGGGGGGGPPLFFGFDRLWALVSRYFSLIQNTAVIGFGAKGVFSSIATKKVTTNAKKFQKLERIQRAFARIHSLAYVAVGVLGALEAMHQYSWIHLGQMLPLVSFASNGLFLYACLYALEKNIELYKQTEKIENASGEDAATRLKKISSVLGIVSNIGYICSIFCSLYPPTQAAALILAMLSIVVGSVKFVYELRECN